MEALNMRWPLPNETQKQWLERTSNWHLQFAFLPVKTQNGKWIWLRNFMTKRVRGMYWSTSKWIHKDIE